MWVTLIIIAIVVVLMMAVLVRMTMREEPTGCVLAFGGICLLLFVLAIVSSFLMVG